MVDIASNAHKAGESDAVKRASSSASSYAAADTKAKSADVETPDAVPPAGASPDVRLEISQVKSVNGFIYKLVDTKTGDIVRQWPTEQMIQMREYIFEHQIQLVDEKA
ncbi:MAG TPA: flagellar protein FlaG [Asticcacaulis sp.]|nr:flagellar protein FlaG [Asticcacaulis sp.]